MCVLKNILALVFVGFFSHAFAAAPATTPDGYRINPGDVLEVFIWNEKDLTREVLVRPDGFISVPLAGHIAAGGATLADVETTIETALGKFLKDQPTVTVSLHQSAGFKIYVLGKVNRPGEYPITRPTDVMQALALAGGLNAFAAENSINVLHREADGRQSSTAIRYGDLKNGEALENNRLLQSGDVVVVP